MEEDKSQEVSDTRQEMLKALEDFKREETTRGEEQDAREVAKEKKKTYRILLQWILIIISLIIIVIQIPTLIATVNREAKPIRKGTYATDALTDQCIMNLWKISGMLQKGNLPGDEILCPASNKPYVVTKTENDVIVKSPDSELYGFSEIRVSRMKPVPELIK